MVRFSAGHVYLRMCLHFECLSNLTTIQWTWQPVIGVLSMECRGNWITWKFIFRQIPMKKKSDQKKKHQRTHLQRIRIIHLLQIACHRFILFVVFVFSMRIAYICIDAMQNLNESHTNIQSGIWIEFNWISSHMHTYIHFECARKTFTKFGYYLLPRHCHFTLKLIFLLTNFYRWILMAFKNCNLYHTMKYNA